MLHQTLRSSTLSLLPCAVLSSIGLLPLSAHAESCGGLDPLPARCQSYAFTAEVTTVSDPGLLFEALSVGDTIDGTFTLDMDVEDVNPANADGFYADAVKCATVDFPSGRSLEVVNDDSAPGEERHILVENDRPQALGGGLDAFTDNVAGTLGGLSRIVGGQIPSDEWINAAGVLGFGYSQACIQGFQTPCPPEVIDDDTIPGPPGDVTGLAAALLEFRVQELPGPSVGVVFSDLQRIDATDPVRCPELGLGFGLAASGVALAGLSDRHRRRRRPTGSA